MKKLDNKSKLQYETKKCMKKRIKNSKIITNVKEIDDEGLIHLKSGEVATLIEVKAIDLSLTSNQEKTLFFSEFDFKNEKIWFISNSSTKS